jgi:hypothetical protein
MPGGTDNTVSSKPTGRAGSVMDRAPGNPIPDRDLRQEPGAGIAARVSAPFFDFAPFHVSGVACG